MKEILQCEQCKKTIEYLQAYIVFNKRNLKKYSLCPDCASKVMVDAVKDVNVPKTMIDTMHSLSDIKKELYDWSKSLKL